MHVQLHAIVQVEGADGALHTELHGECDMSVGVGVDLDVHQCFCDRRTWMKEGEELESA